MRIKEDTYSAISGYNVLINVLLGTGPIFVPAVFIQAGNYTIGHWFFVCN